MNTDVENTKCERCGDSFTCHAQSAKTCWCDSLILSEEALAEIGDKYSNCLCRSCLRHYSEISAAGEKEKIALSWSGGKDSAFALHRIRNAGDFEVCYLLTTVNKTNGRISMHGVREELLEAQAKAIGIPLVKVYVEEGTNEEYEREMEKTLLKFREEGIRRIALGDIFLEDLRDYREANMARVDMLGYYPLWKESTEVLARGFLDAGFRTILCCVNDAWLGEEHVGQEMTRTFVEKLPAGVDPCGENGEFHTFVFDGPIFNEPVNVEVGKKVYKPLPPNLPVPDDHPPIEPSPTKGFWYADILFRA